MRQFHDELRYGLSAGKQGETLTACAHGSIGHL